MSGTFNLSYLLFGVFLCLGSALIAAAESPSHYAAGGIYLICSLALAILG